MDETPTLQSSNPYAAPLADTTAASAQLPLEQRIARLKRAVGDNFEIYQQRWHLHSAHPLPPRPWHWPAFLFGLYWLLFRKMYLASLLFLLVAEVLAFIIALAGAPQVAIYAALVVLKAGLGLAANAMYLRHCQRLVRKVERAYPGAEHRIGSELERRGGTSYPVLVAGLAVVVALRVVVSLL